MDKINLLDIINNLSNKNNNNINHNAFFTITNFSNSFFFSRIIDKQYNCLHINHLQAFYYNIYYIFNKNVSLDNLTEEMVVNMKNKLILNVTKNKSFFKYITNKCKKSSLVEFIEQNESNEYILQYMAESFNITIAVLDCEIDKIVLYYGDDSLDTYNSVFIFSKLNNNYSILFENDNCEFNFNKIKWLKNNLQYCIRCNLEFKLGNSININKNILHKYIKTETIQKPIKNNIKDNTISNPTSNDNSNSNKLDDNSKNNSKNKSNDNNLNIISEIKNITNINKVSLQKIQTYATKLGLEIKIKTSNGKKLKNKTKQQLYNEIIKI